MTYNEIKAAWNAQADEHNQWDELSEVEKIEWAFACAANLSAAAPNLLEAHEPEREGPDFLDWVADRLVNVYGESENVDFVICLRRRAAKARAAIAKALGSKQQT